MEQNGTALDCLRHYSLLAFFVSCCQLATSTDFFVTFEVPLNRCSQPCDTSALFISLAASILARTLQGTLYLSGNGHAEREAVRQLGIYSSTSSDVVVLEHCQKRHQQSDLLKNIRTCQDELEQYNMTTYGDLMNTTFALLPAGRSPATFRLGEALSSGAIPVFIHDNFVKPFPTRIPWGTFSFTFSPDEILRVVDTLRAVPNEKLVEMQVTSSCVHVQQ